LIAQLRDSGHAKAAPHQAGGRNRDDQDRADDTLPYAAPHFESLVAWSAVGQGRQGIARDKIWIARVIQRSRTRVLAVFSSRAAEDSPC